MVIVERDRDWKIIDSVTPESYQSKRKGRTKIPSAVEWVGIRSVLAPGILDKIRNAL